jgi:hypothetical protein
LDYQWKIIKLKDLYGKGLQNLFDDLEKTTFSPPILKSEENIILKINKNIKKINFNFKIFKNNDIKSYISKYFDEENKFNPFEDCIKNYYKHYLLFEDYLLTIFQFYVYKKKNFTEIYSNFNIRKQ